MPTSFATEADIMLAGYQTGYYTIDEVIAWADRWILALDEPPTALLDLSMGRELNPVDLSKLLRSLGTPDASVAVKILFGMIGFEVVSQRMTVETAIRLLFRQLRDRPNGLSERQEATIYQLEDQYYLAREGIYGTVEQTEHELRQFLGPYFDRLNRDGMLPK